MTACMQDGNTETVVMCIAFVPSEAKEHWLWFCRNLRESLEVDWDTITFMTDRGRGLVPAVAEVFPGNEHRNCIVHIGRNMINKYKKKCLSRLAYAASKETTEESCMRQLEKIKEANESAYECINGIEHSCGILMQWTNSIIGMSHQTLQSQNSVLKADRTLTVYGMFSEYYNLV